MNAPPLVCPRCGQVAAPGARTCAKCGEVVDRALADDLRKLYASLLELDALIAAGYGERTIRQTRDAYRDRYLAMRGADIHRVLANAPSAAVSGSASGMATLAAGEPPARETVPVAMSAAPPAPASRPPRPAFSWQAFLADQAIAIMAYLGGFLLLVATLTFEVGGWQVLSNGIKLAVVCAVYLIFGALGALLRRSQRLGTVARIYLGIFALMTPLVALAAYRFELQATGFPASGMLCVAAAYAAVVYLALAQRTRLQTYAYLGWSALLVAVLALVPWLNASLAWWSAALGGVALLLLGVRRVRRLDIPATLGPAATQIGVVASLGALIATEALALPTFFGYNASDFEVSGFGGAISASDRGAFAVGAWVVVGLAAAWSATLRAWPDRLRALLTPVELAAAVLAAQAALAVAAFAHADSQTTAYLLALLAVVCQGASLTLLRLRPARVGLRRGLEGLAFVLALGGLGAHTPLTLVQPSWSALPTLTVAALIPVGIALAEDARWWLLASGFFLTLDYLALVAVLRVPYDAPRALPTVVAALPLALWGGALGIHATTRARRYAVPMLVVALANALLTIGFLSANPDRLYQSGLLLIFAIAAYLAARLLGEPLAAVTLTALFGTLAAAPLVVGQGTGLRPSALALGLALVALAVRRVQGRIWAYGPYIAALCVTVIATLYARSFGVDTSLWSALGVPFAAWFLLVIATLASVASVWEAVPWAEVAPAALAAWAATLVGNRAATVALVFIIAGAGMAMRRWRGQWWGTAWYVAAVFGSLVTVSRFVFVTPDLSGVLALILLGFALLAYPIAALEAQPMLTIAAVVYSLAAAAVMPDPAAFAKTLALTAALPALGVVVSRMVGRQWAWALYASAIGVSVFAAFRVTPATPTTIEALLLIFAAAAYIVSVLERLPVGAVASALYAGAAALAQPDAHALLPLALALALAGLVVGRVAGLRWSFPFYGAAAFTGVLTIVVTTNSPSFEAISLCALALATYVIAAVESRPDVVPVAFLLGVFALATGANALTLSPARTVLAFAALAWVFALAGRIWRVLPWLRPTWNAWRVGEGAARLLSGPWADTRTAAIRLHRWASLLVGTGAVVAGLVLPASFAPHAGPTQAVALALCSLAALLAYAAWETTTRLPLYLAGELVAIAVSWEARWLGADNAQAFILAPGSYLLLVGALLPADERVRGHERLGHAASFIGALLLTLPTLAQSFAVEPAWIYALVMAVEALVIAGVGVGTHARQLVIVGSCFVGLAALRGAILAIQSGLPIPAVIGILAVLLLGGATWLSLRARRAADHVV